MTVDEALKYIISMGVVAPRMPRHAPRTARPTAPRPVAVAERRPRREIDRAAASRRRCTPVRRARLPAPPTPTPRSSASHSGEALEAHRLLRPHRPPPPRPDRHADGLGPPPPRPRRRHLHRPARPRGPGAGRLRPRPRRDVRHRRDAAQRVRASRSTGLVRPRPEGTINPNLVSGEIEVLAHEIEILNASLTPPFQLDDENLSETVRLENRVLDLRRPPMQKNLMLRHRAAMAARTLPRRARLHRHRDADALQVDAGGRARVPGARRASTHGQFYALPQSPQLFKQMLMMAGFDRYYQIVKCFRDEDLRADRQPEFTQIDIETSFLDELEIRELMEGLVRTMFQRRARRRAAEPVPGDDVRRRDARLRLGQAGPARAAQADRAHRPHDDGRLQGVPRRGRPGRTGASPRCASPAAAR